MAEKNAADQGSRRPSASPKRSSTITAPTRPSWSLPGPQRLTRCESCGRQVLVTATTPTPAGEGKTTTAIGLSMALNRIGVKSIVTLREPSLGPVFGMKGGATGGGAAQVLPADEIDLHFTGDIHAVTTANNLLAAMIDNHIQQGNRLAIDTRRIAWRRVIDMNDRALREIVIGLGGRQNGFAREDAFNISVASEVMAVLCLADDFQDLKDRLARMVVGYTSKNKPITAADLKAVGSMALLLKDAIKPNLVQTTEGTPAIIHGGPFANIAHGTNSIQAMRLAQALSQVTVTEAGFASELGGEKFLDFVSRTGKFNVDAVVLVTTLRALKYHGGAGKDGLAEKNVEALVKGFDNLDKHIENMQAFGVPLVVAVNYFPDNDAEELALTLKHAVVQESQGIHQRPLQQGGRRLPGPGQGGGGGDPLRGPGHAHLRARVAHHAKDRDHRHAHVRRRPHQLHPPGAQGHRAAQRARLRQAARHHRQDPQLALRRPQGPGPAREFRRRRGPGLPLRRRRLRGRRLRRDHAHARPAQEPRRREHRHRRRRQHQRTVSFFLSPVRHWLEKSQKTEGF